MYLKNNCKWYKNEKFRVSYESQDYLYENSIVTNNRRQPGEARVGRELSDCLSRKKLKGQKLP